jgi:hypothetical protein
MVNYQNGMIYKIAHRYSPYVYIGSTTNFSRRKQEHKSICLNEKSRNYNLKVYQTIRELGGWDNFEMVLVAKCPCDDKKELHAKEFEYQQLFDVNMNVNDAVKDNEKRKIYMRKYMQKYYENKKEEILENKKKYYENKKEEISEKNKKYREKNNEDIKIRKKKYYENKKEEILEKQKEKIDCECGCVVAKIKINRHRKTQTHIKLMSS